METKNGYLVAQIDTAAIVGNCKILRQLAGKNVRFCPAVKCNAYGHGLEIVLPALKQVNTEMVCVANIAEAQQVRNLNWQNDILLLGSELSIYSDHEKQQFAEWLVENKICITTETKEDINSLAAAAKKFDTKAPVHVMLDSGMTRMGLDEEQLTELINHIKANQHIELQGLYTHFATADTDKTFANQQLTRFEKFIEQLHRQNIQIPTIHAANSAAIIDIPASCFNMVRPGLSVYGYMPDPQMQNRPDLKPALKLITYITMVKKVKAGTLVGYGSTFQVKKDSLLAIVPIGYGDGYNRRLSNIGQMTIAGKLVPVIGRVSMDLTVLDVTALAQKNINLRPGTEVTVIDNDPKAPNSVESIAAQIGTIPYEITTALGKRIIRRSI